MIIVAQAVQIVFIQQIEVIINIFIFGKVDRLIFGNVIFDILFNIANLESV